jgi:hypothetical protein
MWTSKSLVPSWSGLNKSSCIFVGVTYAALFGLIVWLILDVEMPLIAAVWHR